MPNSAMIIADKEKTVRGEKKKKPKRVQLIQMKTKNIDGKSGLETFTRKKVIIDIKTPSDNWK